MAEGESNPPLAVSGSRRKGGTREGAGARQPGGGNFITLISKKKCRNRRSEIEFAREAIDSQGKNELSWFGTQSAVRAFQERNPEGKEMQERA